MTAHRSPATTVAGTYPSGAVAPAGLVAVDDVYDILGAMIVPVTEAEHVSLSAAVGRIAATDVTTPSPLPRFDHSAVDGIGVGLDALGRTEPYLTTIKARVAAGQPENLTLGSGEAARLFTGATIPAGIRAIVMDEKVRIDGDRVVLPAHIGDGDNIRRAGEDIALGGTIVPRGCVIDSRHVAVMAAAGHARVHVVRRIRLAIVSTGNELVPAGTPLAGSQIYDVNGPMLTALAAGAPWIDLVSTAHLLDDGTELAAAFQRLSDMADIVISSGGAAGSQTDHTAASILAAGGSALPLKVALKPGKPIVLGKVGTCLFLGFPGNPVAALVNFLLFGRPAMLGTARALMERPRGIPVDLEDGTHGSEDRTEFAPARIVRYTANGRAVAARLGKAGSGRLMPLVGADGLLEIPMRGIGHAGPAFHPFDSSISV